MGQKTSPIAFRLGINKDWESNWFSKKNYSAFLLNDFRIRKLVEKNCSKAGLSSIKIKRKTGNIEVTIKAAKPGLIIGKGGVEADKIKQLLIKECPGLDVQLRVVEEKNVDLCAAILGDSVARQLEKRVAFRRAMKQVVNRALKAGAKGIKVQCAGRLGGAEIARTEWYREGKVPLQTIRADLDYALIEALTIYGKIGIKVWIYKGDILGNKGVREDGE